MEHAHHLSQDRYWHGWKAAPDAISFEAPELLEMVTRLRESNRQRVRYSLYREKHLFWKGRGGYKTQEVGATHKAQESKELTRPCPKLYDEPAVVMEGSLLEKALKVSISSGVQPL